MTDEASPSERLLAPFRRFAATASAGGVVLLATTLVAVAWANSPWAHSYHAVWETSIGLALGVASLRGTLHQLVNDGLMTVFFFLVGLEIKREVVAGELASRRTAALPVIAALGGMAVPALCYALLNGSGDGAAGWGVPMATDIAFALGVLALLGRGVPTGLKVFLAAFAIVDDIGAIAVIAVFYSGGVSWPALGVAALLLALSAGANAAGVRQPWVYGLIGVALWGAVLSSGVHAAIAGVLLAMSIPRPLLAPLEHRLAGIVAFLIMPVFALANAGIALSVDSLGMAVRSPVALGVILGLALGKPVGITLFAWLSVRLGIAGLPRGVSWRMIAGAGLLGGIGFTMSLFIAALAFQDHALLDAAKVGILAASTMAGVAGWLLLKSAIVGAARGGAARPARTHPHNAHDEERRPAVTDSSA